MFGKFTVVATFALIEVFAIVVYALLMDISIRSIPILILFTIITSMVFVSIIQLFHVAFGFLVSKALSVFMIIVQISSAGGTFPAELCGGFFEAINPYLPFTYSIDGFREIISGNDWSLLIRDIGYLLLFMAIFFALSLIVCKIKSTMNKPSYTTDIGKTAG